MELLRHRLIEKLPSIRGTYREKANLSKTTWFGVGGDAEVLFRPFDVHDLTYFVKNKPSSIPVTILGVGSNLLVRDHGIEGVVIKLGKGFTSFETLSNNRVAIGAGYLNYNVANLTKNCELSGLEFLIGIPGSIGGSLAMNAGAYGKEISGLLESAEVIDPEGNIYYLSSQEINFTYRRNGLPENWIFTKGIFSLTKSEKEQIEISLRDIIEKRLTSQPIRAKTGGSTFMNPTGKKAWELIDEAGCRGLKRGGAEVSEMHCNFLINNGSATAKDLEELGEIVRQKVFEKSGIKLEWEIRRVGRS